MKRQTMKQHDSVSDAWPPREVSPIPNHLWHRHCQRWEASIINNVVGWWIGILYWFSQWQTNLQQTLILRRSVKNIFLILLFFLALYGAASARNVRLEWNDNSDNEEGFIVERTISANCVDGWEVIGYSPRNQNYLDDIFYIPGACYRVAAYNRQGVSTYTNVIRSPGTELIFQQTPTRR